MDRRVVKTRKAIFDAFKILLETKDYKNISVQDIINEANIGRSTFYSHFETKDDLLKSMCEDIFEHVFSDSLTKEKTHDFSDGKHKLKDLIAHILYHVKSIEDYIKIARKDQSTNLIIGYFEENIKNIFIDEVIKLNQDIPRDYIISQATSSFSNTIIWWLENEEGYSPELVADFYIRLNKELFSESVL